MSRRARIVTQAAFAVCLLFGLPLVVFWRTSNHEPMPAKLGAATVAAIAQPAAPVQASAPQDDPCHARCAGVDVADGGMGFGSLVRCVTACQQAPKK